MSSLLAGRTVHVHAVDRVNGTYVLVVERASRMGEMWECAVHCGSRVSSFAGFEYGYGFKPREWVVATGHRRAFAGRWVSGLWSSSQQKSGEKCNLGSRESRRRRRRRDRAAEERGLWEVIER